MKTVSVVLARHHDDTSPLTLDENFFYNKVSSFSVEKTQDPTSHNYDQNVITGRREYPDRPEMVQE